MKTTLIWLGALLALGLLNFAILQKERTLAEGERVYLKLAPLDPRSLMQGDYMVLRYEIANQIRQLDQSKLPGLGGRIIVQLDAAGIAHFVRLEDNAPLKVNERYLSYTNRRSPQFGIESFFFQEGKGEHYAEAEYAEIRLSPSGGAILVDLVKAPENSAAQKDPEGMSGI
jgi:uncharacterized membrane-anchored protein